MKIRPVGIVAVATVAVLAMAGCSAPKQRTAAAPTGSSLTKPSSPVELHILDVSGDFTAQKSMIQAFVKANPKLVSKVDYETGSATDVVGKLQAEQTANRVDIDLILTGPLVLSQMVAQKQVVQVLPKYQSYLPQLSDVLTPAGADFQKLANGYGVVIEGGGWAGPLWAYNTSKVSAPLKSPAALLTWAKAHPGKFVYADPTSGSGPANAFIDALPYMLGDKDPSDPVNGWSKTWAYLQQLNKYISRYPAGTSDTFTGMASGAYDLAASEAGWDQLEHQTGVLNTGFKVYAFDNPILSSDGHFAAVPNGVPTSHVAVDLALATSMLKPDQQALSYANTSVFPVKGVELSAAPAAAQKAAKSYYALNLFQQLDSARTTLPLNGDQVQAMYDKWNKLIGSQK
jgi:putative spermidine/putrescine transport system substrate-binding protein